jgi:hypothetical protein
MPLHGRIGIDLHLGQKPKLGGGTSRTHSSTHHIFGTLYIHVSLSFSLCSCFYFSFQNTKRPKIFLLFLFVCLFSFLVLVCFTFYLWFGIGKIQKDFALFAVSFCACA